MNALNIKAVFFDFDDTLQSRKDAYRLYCGRFLHKYFPYDGRTERENKLYEMEALVDGGYKPREEYFPQLIQLWQWKDHPPLRELYDSFNLDYGKRVVMLPGAIETVRELKRRGYILGMITNGVSELQNMKLDTAGIRDLFDVCVVSGDFGFSKPDRRIFNAAMKEAGVLPNEAVYIGDHPVNDVEGALGAGMNVIRMNYGDFYGKGLNGSEKYPVVENISDVLNFLPPKSGAQRPAKKAERKAPKPVRRDYGWNGSSIAIKVIAIICAVLIAGLAVFGKMTDVFNEKGSEKTILFTSLKGEKKESLQNFINGYCAYFEEGYDSSTVNFDTVLSHLQPESGRGLLQCALSASKTVGQSDPAGRFSGDGSSGYYTVSKSDMDTLASGLSLTLFTDANTRSAYYYDENFYVSADGGDASQGRLYASIDTSSETNDGGYYVVCSIFDNEDASGSPLFTRYFIVDCDTVGAENNWSIELIADSPLFTKTGSKIERQQTDNSLSYTFSRKTMKATTNDGVLFAEYSIEYPVFETDGIAQAACESVYSEKIDEFRTQVSNADSFYEAYIADGGDESLLPLRTNVVVNVTYNKDGYISLVDRTTVYDPTPVKERETPTDAAQAGEVTEAETVSLTEPTTLAPELGEDVTAVTDANGVTVQSTENVENAEGAAAVSAGSKVQYAGYTFEIESGNFIKKDELTGNNYNAFDQKLFEKYVANNSAEGAGSGYYDEFGNFVYGNSSDAESVGTEIFNSAWAISTAGIDFYYIDTDGLLSLVTIPWGELTERSILK